MLEITCGDFEMEREVTTLMSTPSQDLPLNLCWNWGNKGFVGIVARKMKGGTVIPTLCKLWVLVGMGF
jgi:hypothetical protein